LLARSHPGTARVHAGRPWLWVAPLAALAALALPNTGDDGPTLCPFALVTGTACPGCGLTRAAGSLVRGDWEAAFAYHPLVLLVALWLGGAWALALARSRGRDVSLSPRLTNGLVVTTAVLFVVVWLVRLATDTLPPV
jgi:hypothetical protein